MTYDIAQTNNIALLADAWRDEWALMTRESGTSLAEQKGCADRMQVIETRIAELTKQSDMTTEDVRNAVDIALRIIAEKIPSPVFRRAAA